MMNQSAKNIREYPVVTDTIPSATISKLLTTRHENKVTNDDSMSLKFNG